MLIQRGKGGGLAGAFGGMGGSSAFGTKAGDVFTRVTMITALVWILLNLILVVLYNRGNDLGLGRRHHPAGAEPGQGSAAHGERRTGQDAGAGGRPIAGARATTSELAGGLAPPVRLRPCPRRR